jgi:O-antigen/teichoic acid export membrane protein
MKNTTVRAAGEIVGKVAKFLLFAVLARAVGESDVGAFVFAFAFLQIATIPIALGCDPYMLREIARDKSASDRLFWNVVALKLTTAAPVLAIAFGVLLAVADSSTTRWTVIALAPGILTDLVAKTLHSEFNARERGTLLAVSLVVQRVVTAVIAIAALALGAGVIAVAALYSAGALIGLATGAVLLVRNVGVPRWQVSVRSWRGLTSRSWPFALQDLFGTLLFKLDAVLLAALATEAAVGRYGAAYRLLESTLFIAWALNGAFAAMYAYLRRDSAPSIGAVFQRSVKAGLVLLTPVAVAFGLLAEPIMRLAFGADFADGAPALRLLAPVVVLLGVVTLCTSLIVSRLDPRTMVKLSAAMVALNVALNLALIPELEESGAATAMLVTEAMFVLLAMRVAVQEVGGINWRSMLGAPALAGVAMAAVLLALGSLPALALVAGTIVYAGVYLAVERTFSPDDLAFLRATLSASRPWPSRARP